jgi:uncharacterized oligopeptide transporter (OPT) family protein
MWTIHTSRQRLAASGAPAGIASPPTQEGAAAAAPVAAPPTAGPAGPPLELTWQAVVGAAIVSSLVAFSYPYIVLKLGMGPDVSLLSAFLGAIFLYGAAWKTRGRNRLMNNIIQTAGTSASSTAFMCVVAAAFGYLDQNRSVNVHVELTSWKMFTWLICSGAIGVLFIPLFRHYFLSDPKMIFPDGVAAAETIMVMDAGGGEARAKTTTLGVGALVGAVFSFINDGLNLLKPVYFSSRFGIGVDWNLLSVGIGLLIGLRVSLSFFGGTVLVWLFGPLIMDRVGIAIVNSGIAPENVAACDALQAQGRAALQDPFIANCGMLANYLGGNQFSILLQWTMWPATALLVASALTAVVIRWRSIAAMFRRIAARRRDIEQRERGDISLRTTIVGTALLTVLLAYIQNRHFGMSYVETAVAVIVELPLMLAGVRVLGETDFGPVSVTANALQAVFAVFWPQRIAHNLIAAGMAGDGNSQAEGTIQDFKTGQLVGSTPRTLTYTQLCAVPVGAAAVAIMYPLLIDKYGLGGVDGLVAPTGLKMANMAVLLSKGPAALPSGAAAAIVAGALVGIALALASERSWGTWVPSAAGLGFGMILPGTLTFLVGVGGILGWLWQRRSPGTYGRLHFTVAAGLISGDALISGLLLPVLAAAGINLS